MEPATKILIQAAIKIVTDREARQRFFAIIGVAILIPFLIISMAWYIVSQPTNWIRGLFTQESDLYYLERFIDDYEFEINPWGQGSSALNTVYNHGNWRNYNAVNHELFERLMNTAMRYYGWRYIWASAHPSNGGFDCSGFIHWIFTSSGVFPHGRTTAQGLAGITASLPRGEGRAGDLVFFNSPGHPDPTRVITHVGLYLGNGMMIHAGSPIGFADLSTPFWTRYFHSFGRFPIEPAEPVSSPSQNVSPQLL